MSDATGPDAAQSIEALFAQSPSTQTPSTQTPGTQAPGTQTPGAPKPRRRGRGGIVAAWIVGGLVVLLGVAFVLVDNALRAGAESVVQVAIAQQLPGNVTGKIDVHIGGPSVILQYLAGSFERVELDAAKLTVDGVPVSVRVVAGGVPTDLAKPVRDVTAVVTLDQAALNAILKVPGAASGLTLGDGTLGYDGSQSLLGVNVSYHVTAKPKAAGAQVLLTPTHATVTAGPVGLDLTTVVNAIVGQKPLAICVAQNLPPGVDVTKITVAPKAATVTFNAKNLKLSKETLTAKGSCG